MSTVRIQLRRGLASEWAAADLIGDGVVLAPGEVGFITDENTFKVGNGDDKFGDLPYILESSLGDYIPLSQFGTPSGVATLDSSGILNVSQLPALAKVTVASAANQAARLALTAEPGDIAIQTDNGQSYVLTATPASTNGNWQALVGSEAVVDTVEAALVAGTGLDKTYDDTAGTITIDIDSTVATKAYADAAVAAIVDGAPALLNTLNELAAAISDDEAFSATITTSIGTKVAKSGDTMTGALTLSGDPSSNLHAATKVYVDTAATSGISYIDAHSIKTINVHGISDTAELSTKFYADTAVLTHSNDTTSVHGIADTALLATKSYADGAAGAAEAAAISTAAANTNTEISTHSNDTTSVHGIADTSLLVTTAGLALHNDDTTSVHGIADTSALALSATVATDIASAISMHTSDTTSVHGIADTSALALSATVATDIASAITTHNDDTTNVHGIVDTALLATKSYADTAEADAITAAETFTTDAINALDTDDIEEGSTNQYYTSVRATADAVAAMSDGGHAMATDSLEVSTNDFNVGADAKDLRTDDDYTNPIAVFSTAANDYAQVAVKNTTDSANSSTDIIAYASNGADSDGYINIGITSPSFTDADFTITGGNDGYIFMEAPAGTTGDGNLVLATGSNGVHNHIVFAAGGLQSNNTQMTIFPDERVHIEIDSPSTSSTTGALTVVGGVGIQGDLNLEGNLDVNGQVDLSGVDVLPIGPGAATFAESLTNPTVVAVTSHNDYAQIAHQNTSNGSNASTDIIMYPNNGADDAGYVNMGITSSAFADPDFTITGPNDGYIFMVAPDGTTGRGDLVLATGATGTRNAIVFAAGGLDSNNEQMVIIPDQNVHIEIATPSVSPTTGALTVVGGVGIQGDLNIEGDVNIEGTIVFGGAGTTVETSNLSVTDPLVFTGAGNTSDIVDLGLVGEYNIGGSTKYTGIVRDASDGVIKAFKDASTKPTASVNFAEAGLGYSDMRVAGLTASSLTVGDVSNTEFGYLNGVTSPIQTQIDTKLATAEANSTYETISNVALKAPKANPTFTGTVTIPTLNMGSGINIEGTDHISNNPFSSSIQFSGGTLYANGNRLAVNDDVAPRNNPTFTGTVTVAASGVAFTDGTQTKAGVPSITTIPTAIAAGAHSLATGRADQLVPLTGAVVITLPSSGYSTGQSIDFYQESSTGARFESTNGVVGTPGLKFRTTNSVVTAMKTAAGWLVFGDLAL